MSKLFARYLIAPIALVALTGIMLVFPIGQDWRTYNVAAGITPYNVPEFVGMPFSYFALPHALLNIDIGNAINLALNILVIGAVAYRYGGRQWHIAFGMAMTTPATVIMISSNNIDWIPLSAFLVQDWLAYPLLAMKPQMLGMAAIIRFKRNPQPLCLLPLAIVLIASMLIWGAWWQHLGGGLLNAVWNYAPFPFFIPIGIYLLWVAWQRDDEIIAACATPFLTPYFAIYSVTGLHVLLACRFRRAAIWLWVAIWWYTIFTARWMATI